MNKHNANANIFVIGFSGSGKTTIGKTVAEKLGWRFVDTDQEIETMTGKSIKDIFAEMGESHFRKLERQCLSSLCVNDNQVVSTGGGMFMDKYNQELMNGNGIVICLEARPETIHERLQNQHHEEPQTTIRPMLTVTNSLEQIRSLKTQRQPIYALAHWTIHTDYLNLSQVTTEVLKARNILNKQMNPDTYQSYDDLAATVDASSGSYPIWVGWGIIKELGQRVKALIDPSVAYIVIDEGVHHQSKQAQASLESVGIKTHVFVVPSGEQSKTLETAGQIYRWLAQCNAERGHLIAAIGGGVVGDLAGFVSATYLRGMRLIQIPTTLLAMTDASIGGKVAVNLSQGKNLVGSFHQPQFVLTDIAILESLPKRELISGWAEAIKHGLILNADLVDAFENNQKNVSTLTPDVVTDVIKKSIQIKASVVSQDEKETLNIRVLLNYGHTIGHAIESTTGYKDFLHGEAISLGMTGAAYISEFMGLLSPEGVERQCTLLRSYGLPTSYNDINKDLLEEAMLVDKKMTEKSIRWVLLNGIGKAVIRNNVPKQIIREALNRLTRPPSSDE